jgi:hypothetical protein
MSRIIRSLAQSPIFTTLAILILIGSTLRIIRYDLRVSRVAHYEIQNAPNYKSIFDLRFGYFDLKSFSQLSDKNKSIDYWNEKSDALNYVLNKIGNSYSISKNTDNYSKLWDLLDDLYTLDNENAVRQVFSIFSSSAFFSQKIHQIGWCDYINSRILPEIIKCLKNGDYAKARQDIGPLIEVIQSSDPEPSLAFESPYLAEMYNLLLRIDALIDDPPALLFSGPIAQLLLIDAYSTEDMLDESTFRFLLKSDNKALRGWGHYGIGRIYLEELRYVNAIEEFKLSYTNFRSNKAKQLSLISEARALFWGAKAKDIPYSDAINSLKTLQSAVENSTLNNDLIYYVTDLQRK